MITRFPWTCAPLVLALLFVLTSCGRKTDPLTPASPRPAAVGDVKITTRDGVAFLSWSIPTKNVEGKDMSAGEILGFRIYRAELDRDRKKKARYKQFAQVDLAKPAPAEVRDGKVFWKDQSLRYGMVYSYRIRAVSARDGMSQPSDEVRSAPLLSLAAPRQLRAIGGNNQNELTWDPVATRSDGSAYQGFVGYNIYRGTEKGHESETPLNSEPVTGNAYKDTRVANNTLYYYVVRAVDSPALPWKESLDSPEASAIPRDLTPPQQPTGLTVVPGVGRIFLTWNENKERDVAGYYVYRSRRSAREYQRLTEKPINRTTFSDEEAIAGVTWYYALTAVDQAGNESPLSKEQKAVAVKMK